ncbi:MAG: MFS transporter, partial [Propionibacteriaceae bacterium]
SALLNILYFVFLTDVVGLRPGLAGGVVAISKVWDGIVKPLVGHLSDNTRTRWGRRRPFLFFGSFGIVLAYMVLWLPHGIGSSAGVTAAVALGAALFYTTVAALINVPYTSMSTETSTDPDERTQLNLARVVCGSLAGAVVVVTATLLMQLYKAGHLSASTFYLLLVVGFGLAFFTPVMLVALLARERTPIPSGTTRFSLSHFFAGLRVREFRSLLGLYLCQGLALDVIGYLVIAYASYVTKVSTPLFMGILIVTNLIAAGLCNTVLRNVGKHQIYGTLIPLGLAAMAGIALWPSSWPAWPVYFIVVLLAAGLSGSQLMSWVMFPDVVDAAELQLGERPTGSLTGLMVLLRSLGNAVLLQCVGLALDWSGYIGTQQGQSATSQSASAVWAIRLIMLIAVVIFGSLGWVLARRYPLTPAVVARNSQQLAIARQAEGQLHA